MKTWMTYGECRIETLETNLEYDKRKNNKQKATLVHDKDVAKNGSADDSVGIAYRHGICR